MGEPTHAAVLLVVAAFSRYPQALVWGRERLEQLYGRVRFESSPFEFVETDYYTATMGDNLRKQFWAFENSIDPARLPEIKLQTIACEGQYASLGRHAEPRPLNLDPGYLTLAKLVLASTKDHAHRIYLRDGIFAEVTLMYQHGVWQAHQFTFPDYRRADYQQFFSECRQAAREISTRGGPA